MCREFSFLFFMIIVELVFENFREWGFSFFNFYVIIIIFERGDIRLV